MYVRRHRLWYRYVGTLGCVGLVSAVFQWGWVGPGAGLIAVVFVTALMWCSLSGSSVRPCLRTGLRVGVWLAIALVSSAGLVAAFGWSGAIVVVAAVATSPVARSRLAHYRTASALGPSPSPIPAGDSAPAGALLITDAAPAELDDVALCRAWRRTFPLLQAASRVEEVAALVYRRQQYLDELIRRHPEGVSRWLASGARAAGNPLPFLARGESSG